MSEQLIKLPIRYDARREVFIDADDEGLAVAFREHADFIVKCVNSHTALVAVAEAADSIADGRGDDNIKERSDKWNKLEAALAALREQE